MLRQIIFLLWMICFASANIFAAEKSHSSTTKLFWGDTHLHTSYSPDASLNGNTRLGPEQAFRFARGEAIESHSAGKAQLARPLDFLVVADHAGGMGTVKMAVELGLPRDGLSPGQPIRFEPEAGGRFEPLAKERYLDNLLAPVDFADEGLGAVE